MHMLDLGAAGHGMEHGLLRPATAERRLNSSGAAVGELDEARQDQFLENSRLQPRLAAIVRRSGFGLLCSVVRRIGLP